MIANHSLAKYTIILRFFWILFAGEIKFLLKFFDFFEKISKNLETYLQKMFSDLISKLMGENQEKLTEKMK